MHSTSSTTLSQRLLPDRLEAPGLGTAAGTGPKRAPPRQWNCGRRHDRNFRIIVCIAHCKSLIDTAHVQADHERTNAAGSAAHGRFSRIAVAASPVDQAEIVGWHRNTLDEAQALSQASFRNRFDIPHAPRGVASTQVRIKVALLGAVWAPATRDGPYR